MLRFLGAPVTEPQGKTACKISDKLVSGFSSAWTVEVICKTSPCLATSKSFGVLTDPGMARRPRSLRSKSTIIKFSARFFGSSDSWFAELSKALAVPFIGIAVIRLPWRWINSSGDCERINCGLFSISAPKRPGWRLRSREYRASGEP